MNLNTEFKRPSSSEGIHVWYSSKSCSMCSWSSKAGMGYFSWLCFLYMYIYIHSDTTLAWPRKTKCTSHKTVIHWNPPLWISLMGEGAFFSSSRNPHPHHWVNIYDEARTQVEPIMHSRLVLLSQTPKGRGKRSRNLRLVPHNSLFYTRVLCISRSTRTPSIIWSYNLYNSYCYC